MYGQHKQTDFLWGALVGGTVATLTTLLFTTKAGKQLQNKIGDIYDEVEDSARKAFSETKDKVKEKVDQFEKNMDNQTKM